MERLEQLERGLHSSRKEEHLARTRGEDDDVRDERQFERLRRPESKEQDRAERRVQDAQHSAVGTRDGTTADREDQGSTSRARTTLRQATLHFGRHRRKTYEWVCAHDNQYCESEVLTVVEESATASPQLKKCATHVEQSLGASEGDEFPLTKAAESNNEARARGGTGRRHSKFSRMQWRRPELRPMVLQSV